MSDGKETKEKPEQSEAAKTANNVAQRVFSMMSQLAESGYTGKVIINVDTLLKEGKIEKCNLRNITDSEAVIV